MRAWWQVISMTTSRPNSLRPMLKTQVILSFEKRLYAFTLWQLWSSSSSQKRAGKIQLIFLHSLAVILPPLKRVFYCWKKPPNADNTSRRKTWPWWVTCSRRTAKLFPPFWNHEKSMNNILRLHQPQKTPVNKGKEYLSACFVVANVLLAPPPAHDGSPGTARYAPPASSVS